MLLKRTNNNLSVLNNINVFNIKNKRILNSIKENDVVYVKKMDNIFKFEKYISYDDLCKYEDDFNYNFNKMQSVITKLELAFGPLLKREQLLHSNINQVPMFNLITDSNNLIIACTLNDLYIKYFVSEFYQDNVIDVLTSKKDVMEWEKNIKKENDYVYKDGGFKKNLLSKEDVLDYKTTISKYSKKNFKKIIGNHIFNDVKIQWVSIVDDYKVIVIVR